MNWKSFLLLGAVVLTIAGCSSTKETSVSEMLGDTSSSQQASNAFEAIAIVSPAVHDLLVKRSVYFDFDSSIVRTEDQTIINNHAAYLKTQPLIHVRLEGHTDSRGSREYNLALGQRRAQSIKNALELLGISPDQLEAISFGMERPRAFGNTEADYAENRRVDIVYQ